MAGAAARGADFTAAYDAKILHPETRALYGGGDFYNVGDWSRGAASLEEACADLAYRHLDLAEASPRAPGRILDVGCGLGAGTALVARALPASRVTGINLSRRQVEHARSRFPEADFRVMDAASLDFEDGSFDLVLSVEAAFHFETREAFLGEARRVLRPGGCLVLSDILYRTTRWIGGWSVPEANRLPDLESYRALCRRAGFEIAEMEDATRATWLGFCRHLERLDGGMADFARRLERSVDVYLLARLVRP
ncbi:MAG: methyltransferase domain-containing protein [Acidobacteriota bacterium]